jgi:glycosyltransferase 2 family protein
VQPERPHRVWWWAVSLLLAALLLYWSLRKVAWDRVWHTLSGARPEYLALAAGLTCLSYVLRAVRWRVLLNAEARLDLSTVFCANTVGYLGNNVLPARAGEILRTVLISSRAPISKAYVLTTALGERMMDVLAVLLWAALALAGLEPKPKWITGASRGLAIGVGAAVAAVAVLPYTGDWLGRMVKALPLPFPLQSFLLRAAGEVLTGLRAFHSFRRLGSFGALTVVVWTIDAFTMMTVAHALGLSLPFRLAVLLLSGMALGSALPSTPGYVGIYQFVAVTILVPFGMARDEAIAYILAFQALGYVVVLTLGLPSLYWLRRRPVPQSV